MGGLWTALANLLRPDAIPHFRAHQWCMSRRAGAAAEPVVLDWWAAPRETARATWIAEPRHYWL